MRALNVVAGNGIYASPGLDPDRVNRMVLQLGFDCLRRFCRAFSLLELQSIDA
jgi:hypothetical protein